RCACVSMVVCAFIGIYTLSLTTLFRSTVAENLRLAGFQLPRDELNRRVARVFSYFPRLEERQGQLGDTLSGGEQQMLAVGRALVDRKSTRLNSSHVKISYAVFCLKKKK